MDAGISMLIVVIIWAAIAFIYAKVIKFIIRNAKKASKAMEIYINEHSNNNQNNNTH